MNEVKLFGTEAYQLDTQQLLFEFLLTRTDT